MTGNPLPLAVLPDAVQLVADFLRAQPEVAARVGARVYSILPAERTYPLVTVAQVADAPLIARPLWATAADLQLSAYDYAANAARALAELCRGVCVARLIDTHAVGTCSWVSFANLAFLPDPGVVTAQGRPISRWVTTMTVTVHPNP